MKELMRVLALVFKSAYIEEVFPILQYTKFTQEWYGHSQKQLLTQTFKSMFEQVIREHEQKLHTKESPEVISALTILHTSQIAFFHLTSNICRTLLMSIWKPKKETICSPKRT